MTRLTKLLIAAILAFTPILAPAVFAEPPAVFAEPSEDLSTMSTATIEHSTANGMSAINDLRLGRMRKTWTKGFNTLFSFAVKSLKEKGHFALAEEVQQEVLIYRF